MRKIIFLLFALAPLALFAQKKDIQKTSFEVNGVCGMCKARIEKTAFGIKGVKTHHGIYLPINSPFFMMPIK